MPETSGIHEIINPGGSGSSFTPTYSKLVTKSPLKKSKLKIGEIVPGRVIEVQLPDIAIISLPEGIFSAVLHSNLKKDDYLYFKVSETEPGLVLKIYSVPIKNEGKNISVENIIRILFLPDNIFFTQLISFLKTIRKNIVRDEIIKINQFYSALSEKNKNYTQLQYSFRLILFLIDNNLQLTESNYLFFAPIFFSQEIENKFNLLVELVNKTDEIIFEELKLKIKLMKRLKENFNSIFQAFFYPSNENIKTHYFYDTLIKLLQIIEDKIEFKEMRDAINVLISFIDSLHVFNLINFKNKNTVIFILPIFKNGKFKFAEIRAQKKFKTEMEQVELSIETKNFEKVTFKIKKFEDIFEIQIKNKSLKVENIIKEFINTLSVSLEKNRLKLGLVKIVEEFEAENKSEEPDKQNNQVISVVI